MFDFLSEKFSSIFSRLTGVGRLTEKNIDEVLQKVHDALIESDVPYEVVLAFVKEIKNEIVGKKILSSLKPAEQLVKIVHDKILFFLGGQVIDSSFSFQIPSIIMVMGLQGSGKTTMVAKLANYIIEQAQKRGKQRRVLVGSVDFYRPAAVDQLEIMAKKAKADFYRSSKISPVDAAMDISRYAQNNHYEIVILDTAGRLHIDSSMLVELREIDSILHPKYKLLVLDSMTGQESLRVAQAFEDIGFTGALLTKLDSQTRGGAAFAFRYILKKPILFIGTGEKINDFEFFRPERIASRILDMGDMASLLEKAQEKIKVADQEAVMKSMKSGELTLQDFALQMEMMGSMGSMGELVKYLPGASGLNLTPDKIAQGEIEIKKFKAIINSMTPKERLRHKILDASRKKRIAAGAGVSVSDINVLLTRFEQSQQFVKLFKKMGRFQNLFNK